MRLIAVVCALMLAASAQAADVAGKWKGSAPAPDGSTMELVFTFKVDGSTLTGSVSSPMGETPISEGKLDGDAISFVVDVGDFKLQHKGTVAGDTIRLRVLMGDEGFDMALARVPAAK